MSAGGTRPAVRPSSRPPVLRLLALLTITALIAYSARAIDWPRTADALRQAQLPWLGVALVANAAILACWAAFWRVLRPPGEPPVTYGRMFEIIAASSSLMNTLPFGGGHASSVVLLIRRGKSSQRGALSVLALDQLGEGIAKVSIFLLVGALVPLPAWMRAAITTASLVVAAWFVTLIVASRWARELDILRAWRRAGAALAYVVAMKAVQVAAIGAVQHAYGVNVSASGTLLVLAAVILATMVPIAPGNLGTYEASVFFAYRYLGIAPEQALSLAIVQHVCFMLPAVGTGYVFFSAQTFARKAIASR
jgi:uncharacterized membrane protein YbhN (UPF0104 family)